MTRAIGRRGLFHVRRIDPARDVLGHELRKHSQPLRLGSALQHQAAEVQIIDCFGETETKIVATLFRRRKFRFSDRALQPLVSFERAIQQLARNVLRILVIEVFDGAAKVRFIVIERYDLEASLAARDHIETAIGIACDHGVHGDGAPDTGNPVIVAAGNGPDNTEFGTSGFRFSHHFPVSLFKNMQRDGSAWEYDQLEREQR
jgi:hypothetical protein